ncbi:MAG: DUF2997 domain-containing protein [Bacillota bacterium]
MSASMREVVVLIRPDGAIELEAVGFKGVSCKEATEWLEKQLGEVVKTNHKPEYHQRAVNQLRIKK